MSALADISAPGPVLVTGKKKSALDREARAYLSLQARASLSEALQHSMVMLVGPLEMSCGLALRETGATGLQA